jgi:cytochrome P450
VAATPPLFEAAFWRDPYPAYTELLDERPVLELEHPDGKVWLISRYADVRAALADARLSKDSRYTLPPEERATADGPILPMMLLMDPPEHTRLRKLVSRSFTLRRMEELRPRVEQLADRLLDELPESGPVDLMAQYAFLIPVLVICELLGVPAEDRKEFAAWSNEVVDNADSGGSASHEPMAKLYAYLSELIAQKREHPDGALISALIEVAEDGDRLSESELVAMAILLLLAGHETTINLIGNGALALLTHPDQLALLRERPELVPSAVEEFLRWESPIHSTPARFAVEDVEYAGVTIPAVRWSCSRWPRPTAIRAASPTPRNCAWTANPAATSPSATACTTASVRSWRGSRARSASGGWSPGARGWPWPRTRPSWCTGAARWSADSRRCRSSRARGTDRGLQVGPATSSGTSSSAGVREPCWPGIPEMTGSVMDRTIAAVPRAATTTSPMRSRVAAPTGPNQPASIAASRGSTQASSPSTSRQVASTSAVAPGRA